MKLIPFKKDDDRLVDEFLEGNSKSRLAAEELYKRYASKMLNYCRKYCSNRDDAEEILQEGFITIFASLSQFQRQGSFEGWMKTIFRRKAFRMYHEKAVKNDVILRAFEGEMEEKSDTINAETINFDAEFYQNLLDQLPDGYRFVLLLAMDNYSHQEIANELGISVGTSKSQLSKARAMMRKFIAEETQKERNYGSMGK